MGTCLRGNMGKVIRIYEGREETITENEYKETAIYNATFLINESKVNQFFGK